MEMLVCRRVYTGFFHAIAMLESVLTCMEYQRLVPRLVAARLVDKLRCNNWRSGKRHINE